MKTWSMGIGLLLATTVAASAALLVQVAPPKTTGSKAIIEIGLTNSYSIKIESVRATVFLLDDQGKVTGESTRWILGGTQDKPGLPPKGKTTYNFVVSTDKPFTKTKLLVSRVILEGGQLANVFKDVRIVEDKQ